MLSQLRALSPDTGEEQPLGLYFYHVSIRQGWISAPKAAQQQELSLLPERAAATAPGHGVLLNLILNYT